MNKTTLIALIATFVSILSITLFLNSSKFPTLYYIYEIVIGITLVSYAIYSWYLYFKKK